MVETHVLWPSGQVSSSSSATTGRLVAMISSSSWRARPAWSTVKKSASDLPTASVGSLRPNASARARLTIRKRLSASLK